MSFSSPVLELAEKARRTEQRASDLLEDGVSAASENLVNAMAEFSVEFGREALIRIKEWAGLLTSFLELLADLTPDSLNSEGARVALQSIGLVQKELGVIAGHLTTLRSGGDPSINRLVDDLSQLVEAVFEEVERLRWLALSVEAEGELEQGKGKSFANMDAALSYLEKLR